MILIATGSYATEAATIHNYYVFPQNRRDYFRQIIITHNKQVQYTGEVIFSPIWGVVKNQKLTYLSANISQKIKNHLNSAPLNNGDFLLVKLNPTIIRGVSVGLRKQGNGAIIQKHAYVRSGQEFLDKYINN